MIPLHYCLGRSYLECCKLWIPRDKQGTRTIGSTSRLQCNRYHKGRTNPESPRHLRISYFSLLLAPHAQELVVLGRALPSPGFAPFAHWDGSNHAQNDHPTVERKDRPHASRVDEVLQRLRDRKVDARRADGEDDDDFAGDLGFLLLAWMKRSMYNEGRTYARKTVHRICGRDAAGTDLMCDHAP